MTAATIVTEAARYLEAIDVFRSVGLDVEWRSEADEVRALRSSDGPLGLACRGCSSPAVQSNGRHACFSLH